MKKRIFSALLVLAMLFTLMPTAFAEGPYQIMAVTPDTAAPGGTVNVKFTLPEGIDTAGNFTIRVLFDNSQLEVTKITAPLFLNTIDGDGNPAITTIAKIDVSGANEQGLLSCGAFYDYNTIEVAGVTVLEATLKVKEGASGTAAFTYEVFEIAITDDVDGSTQYIVQKEDVAPPPSITITDMATEYAITVTDGTATVGGSPATTAAEGEEVTITANAAPEGKEFNKWEVVSESVALTDETNETTTFIMPAEEVEIKATYKDIPAATYTVSFDANGGTGSMADVTDVSGEYTLPACGFTAPEGQRFKGWATSAQHRKDNDSKAGQPAPAEQLLKAVKSQ